MHTNANADKADSLPLKLSGRLKHNVISVRGRERETPSWWRRAQRLGGEEAERIIHFLKGNI